MKTKFISTIFITFLIFIFSISPAMAALRPLSVIHSPFDQSDRYQTDLFTGSGVYTYPFTLPKGTNDLTPDISLTYNSAAARDLRQYVGIGWQLSNDFIERDTRFTPGWAGGTEDDKFRLHFKGSVYDLVYVASENRYHTKTEAHLNIQKLSGGQNEKNDYYQLITQDGTKYRFGYQTNSELMCDGQNHTYDQPRNYIYRWSLDQVEDTHGNKIFYTYTETNGLSYINKIEYNTGKERSVEFVYTTGGYQRDVYPLGCKSNDSNLLQSIRIKHNSNLIREYSLDYGTTASLQPLLLSIIEKGSDLSPLPATTFTYKGQNKSWQSTPSLWLDHADVDAHLEQANVGMYDVNGDALLDIVRSDGNGSNTWKVLLNQGNKWSSQYQIWINNVGIDAKLDRSDTRLIDVTGDNLPDIIKMHNDGGNKTYKVFRNTGQSWNTNAEYWVNSNSNFPDITDPRVVIMDVNGDGFADVVRSYLDVNSRDSWEVFKGGGNSWNTASEAWLGNIQIDAHLDQSFTRLIDVNGDNLPDIVKSSSGQNNNWWVWKNNGDSWSRTSETWLNNAPVNAYLESPDVALADVNGDGLVDIVKSEDLGVADRWKVLINKGNSWSTTYETWIDPSQNVDIDVHNSNTKLADVNGDGLVDIVKGSADCSCSYVTWRVWKNNGFAPDLLASVKTSQGSTTSFDYKSSSSYDNTGADDISDLPFNLWLVDKKTENNGMTNTQQTNDVTTYSYKDGFYKWQDKEFRGFGTIDENLTGVNNKKYVFNQDDILKGMMAEVQTRDSQNNPLTEIENTWSSSQNNGVYTVKLESEKNYTFDGSASNPKIIQTDYQYDSFGNITKKTELGDTAVTGDERFTYFEYVINSSLWIINTLKHTFLRAADGTTNMSESWLYYDGHAGIDDEPTKGDLTKEVKWLATGTNPTTLHEYDSFGNETKVTDANNRITQFAYDTTGTYPVSTTNAKNQTSTMSYDLGTGNLLSKTDPNNFTTSYEYDVFGRIKKEIKPYDSTGFPTTFYQYFTDGIAPEGTLVSKREISGISGTLDVYAWADGMGRKLQTRAEAEDSTKQIVTDTFYDANGEVAKETVPHLDNINTAYVTPLTGIKTTEFTYDPLERIISVKNTKGDVETTAYDYWKQTHTDEKGNIKREYLNAYEKILKVEEVNGANTYTTNYEYNSRDELTKITDALGNINTLNYDSLGRRTSQVDPDMGTWLYQYDGVDNLTKKTDNRGIATTMTYDELNRRTKVDYPNDVDTLFTYDGNGKIGTLTSITDVAGTLNFSYDNRLRKIQETRAIDGNTFTTQYAYDALDRITTRTNPDGQPVNFAHNSQGEINSVTGIINNIDYNAQGKITKKDFANSITTNYTYNSDDFRLNRIQTGGVFDTGYTYDKVGNVLSITDNLLVKTQNFNYDPLDRLISAQEVGGYSHAYEYNAIGNLTKLTDSSNVIDYTYGQNAGIHALTSSTEVAPTATPTPAASQNVELLNNTWTLSANNGAAGANLAIPSDSLVGKQSAVITFDLHGASFGGGDDEASIVFMQNGDWRAANVTFFGAQNGLNGLQTVTIPLTSFHKVGNSSITLDPNQPVSEVLARFWRSSAFTVDITSIKVVGQGSNNPTPTPTATPTPTPTPTGGVQAYKLVNQCSNKVVSVDNASTSNGANVLQSTWNGGGNQKWKIENTSAGYYKFTALHSGKVLDVSGVSTANGANVHQWEWLGGSNQEWSIIYVGDGFYKLLAKHSGKALDVNGASTQDGANIQQWVDNGTCAQKWQIIEI